MIESCLLRHFLIVNQSSGAAKVTISCVQLRIYNYYHTRPYNDHLGRIQSVYWQLQTVIPSISKWNIAIILTIILKHKNQRIRLWDTHTLLPCCISSYSRQMDFNMKLARALPQQIVKCELSVKTFWSTCALHECPIISASLIFTHFLWLFMRRLLLSLLALISMLFTVGFQFISLDSWCNDSECILGEWIEISLRERSCHGCREK